MSILEKRWFQSNLNNQYFVNKDYQGATASLSLWIMVSNPHPVDRLISRGQTLRLFGSRHPKVHGRECDLPFERTAGSGGAQHRCL